MFKVPDWEDGNPKQTVNFQNKNNKKRKTTSGPSAPNKSNSTTKTSTTQNKPLNSSPKQTVRQNRSETSAKSPTKLSKSPTKPAKKTPLINKSSITIKKTKTRKKAIKNEIKTKNKDQTPIISNIDTDKLDKVILKAKKKKNNDSLKEDNIEDVRFKEENLVQSKKLLENRKKLIKNGINKQKTMKEIKKERLKKMLESNNGMITVSGNQLRKRMLERLKSAQFRYLNEKLYTSSGSEAKSLFQSDPAAFHTYHQGYQQQVKKWPVNPLDVIVKRIIKMPETHTVADMGCGEGALCRRVPHAVRSFDLVASSPEVEVCDMAHTPLLAASLDCAVYCLALMGTDLTQYLLEANRILKMGGHLLIAEVESRFDNVDDFTKSVEKLGFKLKKLDKSNDVFFFMEFVKTSNPPVKKSKLPVLTLKPCLYKRR